MTRALILFDLDGTLVDSADIIVAAQAKAFAALSLPAPTRQRSLSIVGLSLTEAFAELVGADGPVEALSEAYRQAFFELRHKGEPPETLFAGAGELVAGLSTRSDVRLGIATGKSRRGVSALIDKHGWHDLFSTIQTADDAPSKPHPAMVEQAAAEAGFPLARVVMVGDSRFDIAMARAAGAHAIGVNWGFQPPDILREAGAHHIAADFAELSALLDAFGR